MEAQELLSIIAAGEDSKNQFKADIARPESLAQEMVALSNSQGGSIFIGVTDTGEIAGLSRSDIGRLNQLVSNAATDHVRPSISPMTINVPLSEGLVIVVSVAEGVSKPYMDKNLHVYVKSGADKRKVTAREELLRMFQSAALVHADSLPVDGASAANIDEKFFGSFFEKEFGESCEDQTASLAELLENMNLARAGRLNRAGTLLFAARPQVHLPVFNLKAVSFPGVDIADTHYIDSREINGKLSEMFQEALIFALANIRHIQNNQNVNSIGEPEIPRIVFQELIANALIHRDYFVSAPVRVLVFADRVEIISPGSLPNNLTVENIKMGNSNIRNPILASFAPKLLPYRGLASGIQRALKTYPHIEFTDDRDGNAFRVTIRRREIPVMQSSGTARDTIA